MPEFLLSGLGKKKVKLIDHGARQTSNNLSGNAYKYLCYSYFHQNFKIHTLTDWSLNMGGWGDENLKLQKALHTRMHI